MGKPKRVPGMGLSDSKYFKNPKDITYEDDDNFEQLKDGYSRVAHQDAPDPVAYTQMKTKLRGGGFKLGEKKYIYDKVESKETSTDSTEPEATPELVAEPAPAETKDSPEIQSAKERAINYKSGLSTPAPVETTEESSTKAAESFLNNKKMKFSDTLNLE